MTTEHKPHSRDYLERTIETVRNHRDADNCWPSWANVFADEIERLWSLEEQFEAAKKALVIYADMRQQFEDWLRFYAPDDVDVDYMIANRFGASNPAKSRESA